MKIIKEHDEFGWITAIIEDRWVQAKVYDEPSMYGINDGRVSKLSISKTSKRDPNQNYFEQMCYNYDRGLDFDDAPKGLVDKIVAELEKLPKYHNQESEEKDVENKSNDDIKGKIKRLK